MARPYKVICTHIHIFFIYFNSRVSVVSTVIDSIFMKDGPHNNHAGYIW